MTAQDLIERLRARHPKESWAFLEEVPDATGFKKTRTADVKDGTDA